MSDPFIPKVVPVASINESIAFLCVEYSIIKSALKTHRVILTIFLIMSAAAMLMSLTAVIAVSIQLFYVEPVMPPPPQKQESHTPSGTCGCGSSDPHRQFYRIFYLNRERNE